MTTSINADSFCEMLVPEIESELEEIEKKSNPEFVILKTAEVALTIIKNGQMETITQSGNNFRFGLLATSFFYFFVGRFHASEKFKQDCGCSKENALSLIKKVVEEIDFSNIQSEELVSCVIKIETLQYNGTFIPAGGETVYYTLCTTTLAEAEVTDSERLEPNAFVDSAMFFDVSLSKAGVC